ncbi:MAG: hypothetical protein LBH44_07735 [Treponema sp.]|jgi:hypothetical protein|nr:hypothetical protein [Treponema sp.]
MFNADAPDAIALRFIDEKSGYAQNELEVFNTPDGNKGNAEPETIQKADLWGVTGSVQARRIGMYNYACIKNRPFVHTIEADIEYLLCNKGDWIQYAGDLALTGAAQGRITGLFYNEGRCVGIRVDEPVGMAPEKQYAVRLRRSDGAIQLKDVAVINEPDEIYFTEPFPAADIPKTGDIYAYGIRGQEVIDLIITDIAPQADLSAALTCVEYSPAIFAVDDPNFILPEFDNKITPVSGAIDSGLIGIAAWKLFVTYHDDEEEPMRPQGDGQENGWHYAHTSQALWQSSKMAESVDSGEWGNPARIKAERGNANITAVYLALSPQSKILETDSEGSLLAGLLPFTVTAELFKWSYKIPITSDIVRFPGSGGDLFDPMLGDFLPTDRDIEFSLVDAPSGVTINQEGLITVAADAELEDEHSITVQAEYEGGIYTQILFIQVKQRAGEARYLGTIDTLPETPEVFILKGPILGRVRALQGDYVLAVADGTVGSLVWKAGRVYRWGGIAWEYREPERYSELYIRCFKDGLAVEGLKKDMEWFGAVFAELIVAQNAFIEKLQTQLIELQDGGAIQSKNYNSGSAGFRIEGNTGDAEFNKFTARGDSFFYGNIISGPVIISNQIVGTTATPKTFTIGQNAKAVCDYMGIGVFGVTSTAASFGGRALSVIKTFKDTVISTGVGLPTYIDRWNVEMTYAETRNTITRSWADYSGGRNTLGSELVIGGAKPGKTFIIADLPESRNLVATGQVYIDVASETLRIRRN